MKRITKNRYLAGFTAIVILLAIIRLVCPSVATNTGNADSIIADGKVKLGEKGDTTVVGECTHDVATKTSDNVDEPKIRNSQA